MRAEEIICLAILPAEVEAGISYAKQSVHFTFDRMGFDDDLDRRLAKIALGKTCEATLTRYLRQHGIPHLSSEGATPYTDPDRFDLRILNEVVDLKTFGVPDQVAYPDRLLHCLALVPCQHRKDQWSRRKKYERYLFGFVKGRLWVELMTTGGAKTLDEKAIKISSAPAVLYLTAAPAIAECEAHFHYIRRGTICPQYPGGTRIKNMGCRIGELSSFQNFLTKMEKFQRR